jgi:hypothetical protein
VLSADIQILSIGCFFIHPNTFNLYVYNQQQLLYAQIIKEQINKTHLHPFLIFIAKSKGSNSDPIHTVYQMW